MTPKRRPHQMCARPECRKLAHPLDPYCSTHCCKLHNGVLEPEDPKERRNRLRRINTLKIKHELTGNTVTAPNYEAMNKRVPGSYETGKRR